MTNLRRRGFTLIELLIVIAILVVLIGILLPALIAAREHANRVKCMSNIRQLTMAWLMYAGDNRGRVCSSTPQTVPRKVFMATQLAGYNPSALPIGSWVWSWIADGGDHHDFPSGVLWPYVKNSEVYCCPNDPIRPNTVYSLNGLLAGPIGSPKTFLTVQQIKNAPRTFVFIEAEATADGDGDGDIDPGDDTVGYGPFHGAYKTPIYPAKRFFQVPGGFHGLHGTNGCTIAFADGHALFWQYADERTIALLDPLKAMSSGFTNSVDVNQLEAWSGGPMPPGAIP